MGQERPVGFTIPYRHRGLLSRYIPDFIVITDRNENVIVEIKGQVTDDADAKAKAAERWVEAVNRLGENGVWRYLLVSPSAGRQRAERIGEYIRAAARGGPKAVSRGRHSPDLMTARI